MPFEHAWGWTSLILFGLVLFPSCGEEGKEGELTSAEVIPEETPGCEEYMGQRLPGWFFGIRIDSEHRICEILKPSPTEFSEKVGIWSGVVTVVEVEALCSGDCYLAPDVDCTEMMGHYPSISEGDYRPNLRVVFALEGEDFSMEVFFGLPDGPRSFFREGDRVNLSFLGPLGMWDAVCLEDGFEESKDAHYPVFFAERESDGAVLGNLYGLRDLGEGDDRETVFAFFRTFLPEFRMEAAQEIQPLCDYGVLYQYRQDFFTVQGQTVTEGGRADVSVGGEGITVEIARSSGVVTDYTSYPDICPGRYWEDWCWHETTLTFGIYSSSLEE